jgi:hypothetical protein
VKLFVKRTSPVILALSGLLLFIIACTRIDTTELGDELIPAVDNVTTFDLTLDVVSDNLPFTDTLPVIASDDLPVGEIFDDPEFGRTVSNLFFTVYPTAANPRPYNPYFAPDSVVGIDSVVLQLAFSGVYGDTNSVETFTVEEISQGSGFRDSSYYLGTGSFATAGVLGTKVVDFTKFNDSITLIRKRDTTKVVNVLRIRLNNSFGDRLADYDTTNTANGGYRSDSIFSTLVRGLAIKVDSNKATNRGLAYFNLADARTKLQVYYRTKRNSGLDTAVAEYLHSGIKSINGLSTTVSGRASTIRRQPQHGWATYLANGNPNDDRLYIQSSPGSYALLKIPGLDTMTNKVVHLAQLIVPRVAGAGDNTFGLPNFLFMDMLTDDKDSALTVQNDFIFVNGTPNIATFGGFIRAADQTYRYNLTRHVQGIITRDEKNYTLRLYAPYVTIPYYFPPGKAADFAPSALSKVSVPVTSGLGAGRVVLYGGAEADATKKLRLYIVYSKI